MRISIVMAYHDRPRQLYNTLMSLSLSKVKDFEVIIVDDGSPQDVVTHICETYFPQIHVFVHRIPLKDKWWINPCIPYNRGFKQARGDIIIIQNPESIHFSGDILDYVASSTKPGEYTSFACYSTTEQQYLNHFLPLSTETSSEGFLKRVSDGILPLQRDQWYNHPQYLPKAYHFCSAIYHQDLLDIGGGFDERFAQGYCFDDDEFITRIRNSKLKVCMPPTSFGFVVHQWHAKNSKYSGACPEWKENLQLFNHIKLLKGWR